MEIAVEDDDVLRPGAVRRLTRDRPRDLRVLDEAGDDDVLAVLDVRADANREPA